MSAELLAADSSAALLPAGIRRAPRAPTRSRPQNFHDAFDATSMVYDCFRHADGQRVLLVAPPPVNVEAGYRLATYVALPSRAKLRARFHIGLSVMIIELMVPDETSAIAVRFGSETTELLIQDNYSQSLAGSRILFGMNKNNDLAWIREWAAFHQRVHGTDTVIVYENGSTAYTREDVAATLLSVPGLAHVAVPSWPQPFGRTDPAVRLNPYWAHFPQIASMSHVLRRFGAHAAGILNADIDELVRSPDGQSIYDVTSKLRHGLSVFRGQWIEAVPREGNAVDHRDYTLRHRDTKLRRSGARKWALDPRRQWVANLKVQPYWHWIDGRPPFSKVFPSGAGYWHFKGINTNWKTHRAESVPDADALERDADLEAAFAGQAQ